MSQISDGGSSDGHVRFAEDVIGWYWAHGQRRTGQYEISPAWLDQVYQHRDTFQSIKVAQSAPRPAVALWGPSQSGKSTFISKVVDAQAGDDGHGGALDWGIPALFSSSRKDLPENVVVFNPRKTGSDASGCVTRFRLADALDFPQQPVEVFLLSPMEIAHSLACGYESECRETSQHTRDTLERALEGLSAGGRQTDTSTFEALHNLLSLLDLLIETDQPRFSQLNAGCQWTASLRQQLLHNKALLTSCNNVQTLTCRLLWDNTPSLNDLYQKLIAMQSRLAGHPLRCTLEVASVLVDIDAYKMLKTPDPTNALFRKINRVMADMETVSPSGISRHGDAWSPLGGEDDFGLFQGLVRELVVPLRHDRVGAASQTALSLLQQSDLIDFPGVALKDIAVKTEQLDAKNPPPTEGYRFLTEVLKRGKTQSLVHGYSRVAGIDAFVLLMRAGQFPAKPTQLDAGIRSWWKAVDPAFSLNGSGRTPPLPLYLDLTFFNGIIDDLATGGSQGGLAPLRNMVNQLGALAQPHTSILLFSTYPHFFNGQIKCGMPDRKLAAETVEKDKAFKDHFAKQVCHDSLRALIDNSDENQDGGVGFVFETLSKSVDPNRKPRLLDQRAASAWDGLISLLQEQLPSAAGAQRAADIEYIRDRINAYIEAPAHNAADGDPAVKISLQIRRLVNVDFTTLDPIPTNAQKGHWRPYIEAQFRKWMDSKRTMTGLSEIGLDDPIRRTRFLGYMVDAVNIQDVADWAARALGNLTTQDERSQTRRSLAIKLANAMLFDGRENGQSDHPDLPMVKERVTAFAAAEASPNGQAPKGSPHYAAVIAPAVAKLNHLRQNGDGVREPQSGDSEARSLLERQGVMIA